MRRVAEVIFLPDPRAWSNWPTLQAVLGDAARWRVTGPPHSEHGIEIAARDGWVLKRPGEIIAAEDFA